MVKQDVERSEEPVGSPEGKIIVKIKSMTNTESAENTDIRKSSRKSKKRSISESDETISKKAKKKKKNKKKKKEKKEKKEKDKSKPRKPRQDKDDNKIKFSILDYLRTSMNDKLGVDEEKAETKVGKKRGRKSKKELLENGGELQEKKAKISRDSEDVEDFYELLGNDDFMDIPLDVVITTDPSAPENETFKGNDSESALNSFQRTQETKTTLKISKSKKKVISSSSIGSELILKNNDISSMDTSIKDSNVCDVSPKDEASERTGCPPPEKEPGGTHFLLSSLKGSKSCYQCGASFTCSYKLKRHMLSHSDERKFFCDTCGSGFKTNYHLSRHKNNVHSIVGTYDCDSCDKQFASKVSLKEHKVTEHPTVSAQIECPICGKWYASKKGLKRHEKQVHIDD